MSPSRLFDLFAPDPQPDLFGADAAPPAYRPDPAKVRARLDRILGGSRAAAARS